MVVETKEKFPEIKATAWNRGTWVQKDVVEQVTAHLKNLPSNSEDNLLQGEEKALLEQLNLPKITPWLQAYATVYLSKNVLGRKK